MINPFEAQVITEAMQRAVEGRYGEDLAGAAKVPGVPTAGKSGTAQLGGDAAPHSWFIGFAPADAPQIVVAVVVEGGGAGAQRAVPMGGDLMTAYLNRDRHTEIEPIREFIASRARGVLSADATTTGAQTGDGGSKTVTPGRLATLWQRSRNRLKRSSPTSSA